MFLFEAKQGVSGQVSRNPNRHLWEQPGKQAFLSLSYYNLPFVQTREK
jgi:hypothetical protein